MSFMVNVIKLNVANKPFMLSVILLNVVMLSVVMLNVVAPSAFIMKKVFRQEPTSINKFKNPFTLSIN